MISSNTSTSNDLPLFKQLCCYVPTNHWNITSPFGGLKRGVWFHLRDITIFVACGGDYVTQLVLGQENVSFCWWILFRFCYINVGNFHDFVERGENGEVSKSKVVAVMEMFELDHRSAWELAAFHGQRCRSHHGVKPMCLVTCKMGPYKWPYEWVTGVITVLKGVLTPFITGRGPFCGLVPVSHWMLTYMIYKLNNEFVETSCTAVKLSAWYQASAVIKWCILKKREREEKTEPSHDEA